MIQRSNLALAALLAAGATSGCDNPACVFAGTCQDLAGGGGGAGGLGSSGAVVPGEGAFLSPAAPALVGASPADLPGQPVNIGNDAPMFVEFSESLDPDSLDGAFLFVDSLVGVQIPTLPPLLAGDGRVAVVLPAGQLSTGRTYQLFFSEEQEIRDLNGQALEVAPETEITRFTIDPSGTAAPRAFYVYPSDFSTTESDTGEIIVGFDSPMDRSTVDDSSFLVRVDGAEPAFDPEAEPLSLADVPGAPADTRIWTWTPRDQDGRVVPYGNDVRVEIELAPPGAPILDEDGDSLANTLAEFRTLQFGIPSAVAKPAGALPAGAYGRADVFGGSTPLLEVDLGQPVPSNTSAELFLFGTSPSNPSLVRSLVRTVALAQGATSFTANADDLGLVDGAGDVQFADGSLTLGVALRRNTLRSAIRLLDADPASAVLEPFAIDTTPPTLLGLGGDGASVGRFVSGLPDIVAVGRASEPISFAFVDAGAFGTNGGTVLDPPRTAFTLADPGTGEAIFVCAPIPAGRLDPNGATVTYDITIFDQALNASSMGAVGAYEQRGVVGPGGAPTGGTVRVRVLDALTLAPVGGALVFSHQEVAGAVSFVASATSGSDGRASVAGAAAGDTLITVDAPGFDLATFHGAPRDAIDILVAPTGIDDAGLSGRVESEFPAGNFVTSTNAIADSRASRLDRLAAPEPGGPDPTGSRFEYEFGPVRVRPRALGGISFLATEESLPQPSFNAAVYLRGFALGAPLAPLAPGASATGVVLDAGTQLILSSLDLQPIAFPPHDLSTAGLTGLGMLDGAPRITVEAAAAGLDGPLVVGRGIPYDQGAGAYTVLGAAAGLVGPAGDLAGRGAIDGDLFLRAEFRDAAGNGAAARPRLSASGGVLAPLDVPRVLNPPPGGNAGGPGFNLLVADTLPDAAGLEGVVRAELEDASGRRWVIHGLDTSDGAGDLLLSVPDLAADGGSGLAPGSVSVEVTLFGGSFARAHFLYSDLERLHTAWGYAAPVTILVP